MLAASSLFLGGLAGAQVPGLPTVNFQRYFPHIVAVSEETTDKAFPQGVQYKFLTVRDDEENVVLIALTRRDGPDHVVRLFLAKGPLEGSEKILRETVDNFSRTVNMKFEFFDLRDIRTYTDFRSRTAHLGWGLEAVPQ